MVKLPVAVPEPVVLNPDEAAPACRASADGEQLAQDKHRIPDAAFIDNSPYGALEERLDRVVRLQYRCCHDEGVYTRSRSCFPPHKRIRYQIRSETVIDNIDAIVGTAEKAAQAALETADDKITDEGDQKRNGREVAELVMNGFGRGIVRSHELAEGLLPMTVRANAMDRDHKVGFASERYAARFFYRGVGCGELHGISSASMHGQQLSKLYKGSRVDGMLPTVPWRTTFLNSINSFSGGSCLKPRVSIVREDWGRAY